MPKRKPHAKSSPKTDRAAAAPAPATSATIVARPPAKNPSLLAVSVILFALWFVFLLVTAIWG